MAKIKRKRFKSSPLLQDEKSSIYCNCLGAAYILISIANFVDEATDQLKNIL